LKTALIRRLAKKSGSCEAMAFPSHSPGSISSAGLRYKPFIRPFSDSLKKIE
jgi:hypothetical protein